MSRLSPEEREQRLQERKQKLYEETHRIIDGVDHKICKICEDWYPSTTEFFYKNKNFDGLNSYCKECTKKKSRQWEFENKEAYLEHKRKRNRTPSFRALQRRTGKRRREEGYHLRYYENNKDKFREYRLKRQVKNHNITEEQWLRYKLYFENSCAYCGLYIDNHLNKFSGEVIWTDLHREHVISDGADDPSNCIPSCKSCNSLKWEHELEEWYRRQKFFDEDRLEKIYKWLNEDHTTKEI